MATERDDRPRNQRPRPSGARPGDLRRIPLPPLPAFRSGTGAPPGPASVPATGRGLSAAEQDGLLREEPVAADVVPGPGHEGRPDPLGERPVLRTGALGATILHDLVDEIERDLERDLGRLALPDALPAYRSTAACSFTAPEGNDEGR